MNAADFGLGEHIWKGLHDALARHRQVRQALIFGSRARGDYRPESDIDIALVTDGKVPSELRYELDIAARIYKIDVVDIAALDDGAMSNQIKAQGISIYERDGDDL